MRFDVMLMTVTIWRTQTVPRFLGALDDAAANAARLPHRWPWPQPATTCCYLPTPAASGPQLWRWYGAGEAQASVETWHTLEMNTAFLVIDVQQGLCTAPHEAYEAHQVIGRINGVTEKARNAGAMVVFVQHESKAGDLALGTDGWQLASGLQVEPTDLRVRKTTPDAFHCTGLQQLLKEHAVSTLVVCGMHTEFCVDTTTRRALALGFPVILVEDAHTTEGNRYLSPIQVIQHHNETLANISSFGPRVRLIASQNLRVSAGSWGE